jgi:hypothetical protein
MDEAGMTDVRTMHGVIKSVQQAALCASDCETKIH